MTDCVVSIAITGIRGRGRHGVFDHERRDGQDFVVDVLLDVARGGGDDLADTVDYGAVATQVAARVGGEPVNLIETLAERIADDVAALPRVLRATVTVHKPQAPIAVPFGDVAVTVTRSAPPGAPAVKAVVSLGGNLGDRRAALQRAVDALDTHPRIAVIAVSEVYETDPWGPVAQPDFYNAIALVDTDLTPAELLAVAQAVEAAAGRTREVRWGPRTLDVDLIDVDHQVLDTPTLTLPHPRAAERGFVLRPWLDVDPDARLGDRRVAELLAATDTAAVRATGIRLAAPGVEHA